MLPTCIKHSIMSLIQDRDEEDGANSSSIASSSRSSSPLSKFPSLETSSESLTSAARQDCFEQSPGELRPAIATMSLGKAGTHSLMSKLEAAAAKGFEGVEMFWDDLVAYSLDLHHPPDITTHCLENETAIYYGSIRIQEACKRLDLTVLSLQPFRNFDGLLDIQARNLRLREFEFWVVVAHNLGASVIGVPSTITPGPTHTGDQRTIANDLLSLCHLARPFDIDIAYENLCFGAHIRSWSQAWDIITLAGRPKNLAFLPDTFNLCGDAFADPSNPTGKKPFGDLEMGISMKKFTNAIPLRCLRYIQVADAEMMDRPLTSSHPWMAGNNSDPKMIWSRNARLFPGEKGGYLPVFNVIEDLIDMGWTGWVSLEIFSRTTSTPGESTIEEHATRAWASWEKIMAELEWRV